MKKFDFDRDYFKLSFYLLAVIIIAILFEKVISNLPELGAAAEGSVKTVARILSPFVYAFFIAFFLNPFVRWLQNSVLTTEKISVRHKRILASVLALLLFIGVIAAIFAFVLPEVVASVYSLIVSLPDALDRAQLQLADFLEHSAERYGLSEEVLMQVIEPFFTGFGTIAEIMSKIVTGTLSFGKGIFNFLIGLIIAFYMLIYKDGFKSYWTKLIYTAFKPERAEVIIKNGARINKIYESFFVGKTLDSAIIGVLSFAVMTVIIKPRYVLLSSVVIGITNMIPFFGPFIGAVPVVLINLLYDVKTAAAVALFILILQQFDGYILGPKILGDSTGLSPFWVIASILIGGSMLGFVGMFLGVPTFAVIKMFTDEAMEKRFRRKFGKRPPSGGNGIN